MGILFRVLKFKKKWGMPDIQDIFGVTSRCWAQAYVWRKKLSIPPLGAHVRTFKYNNASIVRQQNQDCSARLQFICITFIIRGTMT